MKLLNIGCTTPNTHFGIPIQYILYFTFIVNSLKQYNHYENTTFCILEYPPKWHQKEKNLVLQKNKT